MQYRILPPIEHQRQPQIMHLHLQVGCSLLLTCPFTPSGLHMGWLMVLHLCNSFTLCTYSTLLLALGLSACRGDWSRAIRAASSNRQVSQLLRHIADILYLPHANQRLLQAEQDSQPICPCPGKHLLASQHIYSKASVNSQNLTPKQHVGLSALHVLGFPQRMACILVQKRLP